MYTKKRFQKLAGLLNESSGLEPEKLDATNDDEGAMTKNQLEQIAHQSKFLAENMPDDAQLEGWVQSKITLAQEMIDTVYHYLVNEGEQADKTLDEKKGLWDNIHAKRKRGEAPAKPGDEDYPDSKSWKKAQE